MVEGVPRFLSHLTKHSLFIVPHPTTALTTAYIPLALAEVDSDKSLTGAESGVEAADSGVVTSRPGVTAGVL